MSGSWNKGGFIYNMGEFIYYFCGVLGMLRAVTSLADFGWNPPVVYLVAFLCCGGMCLFGMIGNRRVYSGIAGMALCGAVFAIGGRWLGVQLSAAVNLLLFGWMPNGFQGMDLTFLLIAWILLSAVALYWLSVIFCKGSLLYPVTGLLVAIKPLLTGVPDLTAICLLAFFHLGDRAMAASAYRKRDGMLCVGRETLRRSQGWGILALTCLLACILPFASGLTWYKREMLFQAPLAVEQGIRQSLQIQQQLPVSVSLREDGHVSRGNRHVTGQDVAAVKVSEQPKQTIYLRQFTGGAYGGDAWQPADETAFLEERASWNPQKQRELEQYLAELTYQKAYEVDQGGNRSRWMAVKMLPGYQDGNRYGMSPYISAFRGEEEDVRQFSWYSLADYYDLMREVPYSDMDLTEEVYTYYVYEQYTQVEEERFPRLAALCRENPASGWEEATDFILRTLRSQTSYSMTPGVIPAGEEIPEYFLFERKQGYCVHYATTAVLMYRMYGIPARYVAGYIAPVAEFSPGEDGNWNSVVQDSLAHAWPEIYVAGLGWIPVEATPPSAYEAGVLSEGAFLGQNTDGFPELDDMPEMPLEEDQETEGMEIEENTEQHEEDNGSGAEESDAAAETETETDASASDDGQDGSGGNGTENQKNGENADSLLQTLKAWLLPLLFGLVLVSGALYGGMRLMEKRRNRILIRQKRYGPLELYARLEQVMRLGGCPVSFQEGASVCAARLEQTVSEIDLEMARQAMAAVDRAAFGIGAPSPEERLQVWKVYEAACRYTEGRLNPAQRWYFRYVKVFW